MIGLVGTKFWLTGPRKFPTHRRRSRSKALTFSIHSQYGLSIMNGTARRRLNSIASGLLTSMVAMGAVAIAAPAEATTFKFEWDRSGLYDIGYKSWCHSGCSNDRNNRGLLVRDQGAIQDSIVATYNDQSERLTWEATYSPDANGNNLVDGGWLVLTDGKAPKNTEFGDHAIFYMDAETGRLSAYAYTGQNNKKHKCLLFNKRPVYSITPRYNIMKKT